MQPAVNKFFLFRWIIKSYRVSNPYFKKDYLILKFILQFIWRIAIPPVNLIHILDEIPRTPPPPAPGTMGFLGVRVPSWS